MARSFAPSLLVLATLIALVLPQLGLCAATLTHSEGQENVDTSLSTPTLTYEYDVFVSFRGTDTRTGFTGYLLAAFGRKRIHAYRDDEYLPRGGEIGPLILKVIEKSRIAVVVFSKNYAASDWCLVELVKIMECKRLLNQTVLPIFYDVSPSEVQKHKGHLAEAILNGPEDKVINWMAALKDVANLAGLHLKPYRLEPEFIEEIVEITWKILHEESPTSTIPPYRQNDVPINRKKRGRDNLKKKESERNPKETTGSCYFAPLCVATMARSFAPSLLVLATLIALVLPLLGLRAATMTHSEGQENFDTSLSTPTLTHEYDVFVSFRGEDTRTSFTAHLYAAFDREGIRAYRDEVDLPREGEIGPELLMAIETSRIALVVFSKNYATSSWCLDELVKIMKCKSQLNQIVLPIFYKVSPSEVRNHNGYLLEAILNGPEDKVNNWMAALKDVANLAGLHLEPYRREPKFIENIVEEIWKFLHVESSTSTIPPYRQNDVPM